MALIATKISSRSCFVSAYPNNSPTFLISKFPNTVDSLSPANTAKRSILRNVHASVSNPSKQFHNKTSLVYIFCLLFVAHAVFRTKNVFVLVRRNIYTS